MDEGPPDEIDVEDALRLAFALHQRGQLVDAGSAYDAILARYPAHPDALHYRGLARYQTGDLAGALADLRASLAAAPENAHAWCNLGNLLRAAGDRAGAEDAGRRAVTLAPGNPAALNNLGVLLKESGRYDEAETCYRRAVAADPGNAGLRRNLAHLLAGRGRHEEALAEYQAAARLRPEPVSWQNLVNACYRLGRLDLGLGYLREWLRRNPDDSAAKHLLAGFTGERVPRRASDAYVTAVFDEFADTFDDKLGRLEYRGPEAMAALLRRVVGEPAGNLRVLDAGCGTGLCGAGLRPYASRLTGVDLSPRMLARARARGTYDDLTAQEITAHLSERPAAFDAIVSADTFLYFGDLAPLFAACALSLAPGGLLAFTLEDSGEPPPPGGFRLNPNGRYAHHEDAVREALRAAGFAEVATERVALRMERGQPVPELVVSARKRLP